MRLLFFLSVVDVPWDAIGYSLIGFIGGFLSGAFVGKQSSSRRDKT